MWGLRHTRNNYLKMSSLTRWEKLIIVTKNRYSSQICNMISNNSKRIKMIKYMRQKTWIITYCVI